MMHSFQDFSHGPSVCFEKERLSGVHFHERSLSESTMTRTAPYVNETQQPTRRGTGVYYENSEVKASACCIHPLQAPREPNVNMIPPMPCPAGQPLFAPPILATSLQVVSEDADMEGQTTNDSPPPNAGPLQTELRFKRWSSPASITLKDCSRSCLKGMPGDGCHLFCETKRTAMRQRLHSRDYRLSTDEQVFVEAAVKLSKGMAHSVVPAEMGARDILAKPSLACYERF